VRILFYSLLIVTIVYLVYLSRDLYESKTVAVQQLNEREKRLKGLEANLQERDQRIQRLSEDQAARVADIEHKLAKEKESEDKLKQQLNGFRAIEISDSLEEDLKTLQQKIDTTQSALSKEKERDKALMEEIKKNVSTSTEEEATRIEELNLGMENWRLEVDKLNAQKAALPKDSEDIKEIETQVKDVQFKIRAAQLEVRELSLGDKERKLAYYEQRRNQLAASNAAQADLENELKAHRQEYVHLDAEFRQAKQQAENQEKERRSLERKLDAVSEKIASLSTELETQKEVLKKLKSSKPDEMLGSTQPGKALVGADGQKVSQEIK
jgi:chromosome segregation protein